MTHDELRTIIVSWPWSTHSSGYLHKEIPIGQERWRLAVYTSDENQSHGFSISRSTSPTNVYNVRAELPIDQMKIMAHLSLTKFIELSMKK